MTDFIEHDFGGPPFEGPPFEGLADPRDGRDACGVGFITRLDAQPGRDILTKTFEALGNLAHRGAIDADGKTGDGAGILTAIPHAYYVEQAHRVGKVLPQDGTFAVMMIFYPQDDAEANSCRQIIKDVLHKYGILDLWSRVVPVDESVLGEKAASVRPIIHQRFLEKPIFVTVDEFEHLLFLIRKEIETIVADHSHRDFYIPSLSSRTIVHKGLFVGNQICDYYRDLKEDAFISPFALFHQRYSTNTFPSWALAQPFRMVAHNGEINTIRANRNWMRARELADQPRLWLPSEHALKHFIVAGLSDSASFDNALEAYVHGGRGILHSIIHMMPEAWQQQPQIEPQLKAFYEYHACLSEQWDGPAAMSFTDGKVLGAILDRNGLRPARYKITSDYLFVCSEMGCVSFATRDVVENGKLSPGKVIGFNLQERRILKNGDIKSHLAALQPYGNWVKKNVHCVEETLAARDASIYEENSTLDNATTECLKRVFAYTLEDVDLILHPMFQEGKEPLGSMGDDTPLAVFSVKPRLLYHYFRQLFAQVTNPPIDSIREKSVTSLRMYLGRSGNIFNETPQHALQMRVRSPVVTKTVFDTICHHPDFPSATLSARFKVEEGPEVLADVLMSLGMAAEKAIDDGKSLIILSDRYVDSAHAPIPMLLAVSSVHHHLIRVGKRLNISLLVETGEAREVHHMACLIGFGASVIYPYLALKQAEDFGGVSAIENYIKACETGILKIMSKMGISVLQSYHAAQLFEAVGLSDALINYHFFGTPNKISGASLVDIAEDYLSWHAKAFSAEPNNVLDVGGYYRFRRGNDFHAFNPDTVRALHKAVSDNDAVAYATYRDLVNHRPPTVLRDLLDIKKGEKALAVAEVESIASVIERFCTPGISYGAISKEVHEDFAIAMNRLGAKSDSGEGGEDPTRFEILENGDSKNSAIKQVASGRFGVTAYYLSRANELEIKIAQGAKPGEGGQLPGHKVSTDIARIRHSTPGVTLISPPPHHDIYSIEDLSQLIYDLKQANPKAKVCVKLVAEDGVGTIAAGVVKAHADVILISGYDGGTGASSLSSIKHAGLPWELGLAEAQQVLTRNGLRERVILRVDGGFKTGLDVVKAALLGAEEFGFGTVALIAVGCVMVRQCHLNTCPVGVATQDPVLRAKYKGSPDRVISFFSFVAQEVRMTLAEMGFSKLTDIIGRTDLLEQIPGLREHVQPKLRKINLRRFLTGPPADYRGARFHTRDRNDWDGETPFDHQVIRDAQSILQSGEGHLSLAYLVRNVHRSVGTQLSYEIVNRFGPGGLPQGQITVSLLGTVGQSFGAFAMSTLKLDLVGEANDYVGKGLSGAVVTIRPPEDSQFTPEDNIICGNTCLYGATSGSLFVNGRAGERFAVRNSGALAVVEGVGDHGCEYMTGGFVLVLGEVGTNFGAGMTGGQACVYDARQTFRTCFNPLDVEIFSMDWQSTEGQVFYDLLVKHKQMTNSPLAGRLLKNWQKEKKKFLSVVPKESLVKLESSQVVSKT